MAPPLGTGTVRPPQVCAQLHLGQQHSHDHCNGLNPRYFLCLYVIVREFTDSQLQQREVACRNPYSTFLYHRKAYGGSFYVFISLTWYADSNPLLYVDLAPRLHI